MKKSGMGMQKDLWTMSLSSSDAFKLSELTGETAQHVVKDMALIARGEELDLTWRRLRTLIDYELVEITTGAILGGSLRGSRTTIGWTNEGIRLMSCKTSL